MSAQSTDQARRGGDAAAPDRWLGLGVGIFLAAIIWVVFGQTAGHEFVNLDDNENVYENPAVSKGLSLQSAGWAFTHTQVSRWVPLSTLAHMLDCQLYGLWPGGHHLTSVLLHAATSILLFLVLRRLTGAFWRSAFVAALFAIHPLHVEAVAWVSALQYTLSGFFFMLTLWAYVQYVRHPRSPVRYGVVLLLFAATLLAKEMLVTLPLVLLLLDYWPLRRTPLTNGSGEAPPRSEQRPPLGRLIGEKIPLLAFSAVSCVITLVALRSFRQPVDTYTWPVRVENALVSYTAYLGQMVYPEGLTAWYPHRGINLPLGEVLLSLGVLATISAAVFVWWRKRPYLLVGWLWYLGMLIPVIGLIQRGEQERCDRYTYLSQIGLYIMIAWGAAELFAGWRHRRLFLGSLATVTVVALMLCARVQASYWRNSEALWTHTLAHTTSNYVAHNNLAIKLAEVGRLPEAMSHFQEALRIKPTSAEAQNNVGYALALLGRWPEAIPYYEAALRIKRDFVNARMNLADALAALGKANEAQAQYQEAARLNPNLRTPPGNKPR